MTQILKFPVPETVTSRDALQEALGESEPLTNVIILSQRENGDIYHMESDGMTLAQINWILDTYKFWLLTTGGG